MDLPPLESSKSMGRLSTLSNSTLGGSWGGFSNCNLGGIGGTTAFLLADERGSLPGNGGEMTTTSEVLS